jgi:hypothetical protein
MNDTNQRYRVFALGRCASAHTNCTGLPSTIDDQRNSSLRHVFTGRFAGIGMKRSRGRVFVREGVA